MKGLKFMKILEAVKGFFNKMAKAIKVFFSNKVRLAVFILSVISIIAISLVSIACFNAYVSDYYHADLNAIRDVAGVGNPDIYEIEDGVTVFNPKNAKTGIIFYPGAKVEHVAYAPLMDALAESGILCVLIEMPYNLAIFDINAADGIQDYFPEIENWYMAGHSLGGAMAATYLDGHTNEFDGVILLGAYSTVNITDSRVLSIYGSFDRIMNREKYSECKKNLPKDFKEVVIQGGNHAGFAMYGHHEGDGVAEIDTVEQIEQTVKAILEFISED
jgi:hypothetical protein